MGGELVPLARFRKPPPKRDVDGHSEAPATSVADFAAQRRGGRHAAGLLLHIIWKRADGHAFGFDIEAGLDDALPQARQARFGIRPDRKIQCTQRAGTAKSGPMTTTIQTKTAAGVIDHNAYWRTQKTFYIGWRRVG